MLKELKQLSEKEDLIEADELRRAAAVLLKAQFVYADIDRDRKVYSALATYADYFDNLFDALGHDFFVDQEVGMIGIVPRTRNVSQRLKQDEALLLLTLRLLYEDALESFNVKRGCAEVDSEKLLAKFEVATGRPRPNLTELRRILNVFAKTGVIEKVSDDDRRLLLRIRPAIRLVLDDGWLKTLEVHAGIAQDSDLDLTEDFDESEEDGEDDSEEAVA